MPSLSARTLFVIDCNNYIHKMLKFINLTSQEPAEILEEFSRNQQDHYGCNPNISAEFKVHLKFQNICNYMCVYFVK